MEAIGWTHKPESNGLEELGDLWLWGMSFMQKSPVRAGPGNLVGRKQNKQVNRENKDWPMAFSKAWVHWDFSGCPRKDCIKEDPCKANRPRKKAPLPLHTGEGLHSAFSSHSASSFKANLSSPQAEAANSDPHNPSLYLGWRVERWRTQPEFIMMQWTFASDHRKKPQKQARDKAARSDPYRLLATFQEWGVTPEMFKDW